MYNPLYYLLSSYDGYKSTNVASYFRINTGITQGDTSNCVEMNLVLALKNYGINVEFTTVWEQDIQLQKEVEVVIQQHFYFLGCILYGC